MIVNTKYTYKFIMAYEKKVSFQRIRDNLLSSMNDGKKDMINFNENVLLFRVELSVQKWVKLRFFPHR